MKISRIKVNNYRLLKEFELDLEDQLSLIIGKNNCGKTSLLSILDKFIGGKSNTNNFAYDDFNVDFQKELAEKIENNYIPTENDVLFPTGISMKLFIQYGEDDDLANISTVMMDLDPDNKNIVLGFEYTLSQDDFNKLKNEFIKYKDKRLDLDKKFDNKDALAKRYFADFIRKEYKKFFKISKKSIVYDLINKKEKNDEYIDLDKNKISLDKIINFKYISARRSVSNVETDNTLSILSSKYYEKIEENDEQKTALDTFKDEIINTDRQLDKIYDSLFNDVVNKVKKFGGIKPGESTIKIVSSLKRKELLKGNTTVMYNHNNLNLLPENYNGLGYLNLISMIFEIEVDLSEFRKDGKDNQKPADINLFFIEEPEAHTHPQMQYVFIKNIKDILKEGYSGSKGEKLFDMQTIITTHSSHITSEGDFNDIKYFYKTKKGNVLAKNLKSLEIEYSKSEKKGIQHFKFLKQYLTLNRSELFFADKAILIEGDTERILLPAMMKKIDQMEKDKGVPMLSQNISIVEVGAYSHIFERFIDFIQIKSLIITDIDSAKLVEATKKDGTPKQNKNGEVSLVPAPCRVYGEDGKITTNASIKFFYSMYIEKLKSQNIDNELQSFADLPFDEKKMLRNSKTNNWEQSAMGEVAVTYQVSDENGEGLTYHARSFEDAFFHINRKFILENKENFKSLKHIDYFDDTTKDAYDLAEKCIDKKPSFAMEILLNSKSDKEGNKFSNWDIPNYIKEGLLWLKQD
ncbi:ATP-dependent nuclease [Clostridium uliginosum]|uniref:Predicted ATP-dependent endonuclease of the OLD family, contains P-loop ATPase and TOPRIM domains n=1 Tax=Clostridium uliginosum TaxID=119641 RepID=A0A1I1LRR2_9CLOT|nr:ATP-dependent endonuclease [Clostridium uliginosum]SFC75719.1 Predicted ATP-dependent endonuclease of the OLD family, contains P-loop ATPase and TOPRIM domains [Clostridium uliginosum]